MNICFYGHGGSDNHGCEALVRSTYEVLKSYSPIMTLYSQNKEMDYKYGLESFLFDIVQYHRYFKEKTIPYMINFILRYGFECNTYYYRYANEALLRNIKQNSIYFSIGGDNYCYGNYYKNLAYINKKLSQKVKNVLWGVSIEEDVIIKPEVIEDLKRYSLITARETMTFNALLKAGISKNTHLIPDTAFILPTVNLELPEGFIEGKTIGINLSPLVQRYEMNSDMVYRNYRKLIEYIIKQTNKQVALIPHVVIEDNSDLTPLTELFNEFKHTKRVVLIEDHNCMELKGFISRCCLFVGARTHATIAAYSTYVPTLAVGYSIKAKGIAKDLFGDYSHYVVPVQEMKNDSELTKAFIWMLKRENEIKDYLEKTVPNYIKPIENVIGLIEELGCEKK
ncbi:polysaccharide pyruvyl transferase family protein [Cellulosilyticum sp. I15G10I2]|uniref:polysaccharide pyruvyl transferase family protein n=1 Tax=Cellulosilyticum sp. I15G10I2 TaxID=1892843 RepID=UPI00085BB979|nr:polysaccharide pyruvyl transferase family protein [Cellulosilyticum sp. I15G10I2]